MAKDDKGRDDPDYDASTDQWFVDVLRDLQRESERREEAAKQHVQEPQIDTETAKRAADAYAHMLLQRAKAAAYRQKAWLARIASLFLGTLSTLFLTIGVWGMLTGRTPTTQPVDVAAERMKDLDRTPDSLETLIKYVDEQKAAVQSTSETVARLESEKQQLSKVVAVDKANLEAWIAYQEQRNKDPMWWTVTLFILNTLLGVALSIIASYLWDRHKAKRAGRPAYYA